MNETRTRLLAALVAVTVVASAGVGFAAAASNGSLTASPAEAGATATHTATATAGNDTAGSWNGFTVDYTDTGADVSDVDQNDLVTVGIDRGDDSSGDAIDVDASDDVDDVQISNNGETLTVNLGGSYDIDAGDEVVVVYENAVNPTESGAYDVPLDINPQSSGGETSATFEVASDSGDDTSETTTDATTDGDATTEDESTTDGGTTADDDESGGSPGFGVAIALVAVLGATLLALRE